MSDQKITWKKPVQLDPSTLTSQSTIPPVPPQSFDPQQITPVDNDQEPALIVKKKKKTSRRRWLSVAVSGFLGVIVGSELYRFISWGFEISTLLGTTFTALSSALFIAAGYWIYDALRGLRQLAKTEELHQQAQKLATSEQHGNAHTYLKRLDKHLLNTPMNVSFKEAIRQVDSAYNDREIIQFVANHSLTEQDQAAKRCIKQHSIQSGLMVALSPYATFDMLLVGWRNLKMLREVAAIYGIAPGVATQWKLLHQVLHNIAFSGLSEWLIDAGTQALGTSLTGQVSARAAQGIGAGLFTARTGTNAMLLCRPLPLSQSAKRELTQIHTQIINAIAQNSTTTQHTGETDRTKET